MNHSRRSRLVICNHSNIAGSILSSFKMFGHTCAQHSHCSSFSNLGIIIAHIFPIPRSLVMIVLTLSLFMLNSSAIILTVRQQSLYTFFHMLNIFPILLAVLVFCSCGHLPRSLFQFLNLLCLSKIRVLDFMASL